MHITIKGKPYNLTTNELGWGVVSLEKKTDRFHKSYQVFKGSNGAPVRCSCGDYVERQQYVGGICKHMSAVLDATMPSKPSMDPMDPNNPANLQGGF